MKRAWGIWDETSQKWLPNPLTGQFGGPARYKTRGEAERAADQDWRPLNPDRVFTVKPIGEETHESSRPQKTFFVYGRRGYEGPWIAISAHVSKREANDEAKRQGPPYGPWYLTRVVAGFDYQHPELPRPWVDRPPAKTQEARYVADFDTLDDLIQHAAVELGATHVIVDAAQQSAWIFFPLVDGRAEEARVRRHGNLWHAEGPGAREIVTRIPRTAKTIEAYLTRGGRSQATKRVPERESAQVRDYVAFDRRGRPIGPPFKRYSDARDKAERAGGHVEFVPRRTRENVGALRPSKQLEAAVRAWQLYYGSGSARVRDQQKLYDRARRAAERIAKTKDMDAYDVMIQLQDEAHRRGPITPMPGKDI